MATSAVSLGPAPASEGVTVPKAGEFAVPPHDLVRMVNENQPRP